MSEVTTGKLVEDLRVLVADAEALLAATAGDLSDKAKLARRKAAESIENGRARLEKLESQLGARAEAIAEDATAYIRENPWQSVGIAAAVGIVLGVLLGRR
jgi:ElaB/YqjD/DUF883 family membrane-anchored ribosome-binding protein